MDCSSIEIEGEGGADVETLPGRGDQVIAEWDGLLRFTVCADRVMAHGMAQSDKIDAACVVSL